MKKRGGISLILLKMYVPLETKHIYTNHKHQSLRDCSDLKSAVVEYSLNDYNKVKKKERETKTKPRILYLIGSRHDADCRAGGKTLLF